ncbi:hypothetical protein [Bradyrhizobium sp.]|uniref:hypothetical protein n=1 Tax=Bradyrhizobium sp. TaxID=376 RepID=UPI003C77346A
MTIIRREAKRNYSVIINDCFADRSLSGELLGMITYLLSRPDNWQVKVQPLAARMRWGRDKTYNCLNALADHGYIERRQDRDESSGKFGPVEYLVYDERVAGLSSERKPMTEMPLPENQKAAKRINTESQKILPPKSPKHNPGEGSKGSPREEFRPSPRVDQLSPERTAKPWAERGKYEAEIIARLGAEGMDILSSLEEWKLTQLCRSQSRGTLTDERILELKTNHRTSRVP